MTRWQPSRDRQETLMLSAPSKQTTTDASLLFKRYLWQNPRRPPREARGCLHGEVKGKVRTMPSSFWSFAPAAEVVEAGVSAARVTGLALSTRADSCCGSAVASLGAVVSAWVVPFNRSSNAARLCWVEARVAAELLTAAEQQSSSTKSNEIFVTFQVLPHESPGNRLQELTMRHKRACSQRGLKGACIQVGFRKRAVQGEREVHAHVWSGFANWWPQKWSD